MRKKKAVGTKTDRIIKLVLEISNSRNWTITEERLKEIWSNLSRSQFYSNIQELITESATTPALLHRIQTENGNIYKLHNKTWENFYEAKDEGAFLLECHKKLGYLLENGLQDIELAASSSNKKNLARKFFYLSVVQGRIFNEEKRGIVQDLIKALMSDAKLSLLYNQESYIVLPLSLIQHRDELYIMGYKNKADQKNIRTFKVNRIKAAKVLEEKFRYPAKKNWDPVEHFKDASGLIVEKTHNAIIQVYGNARKIIQEKQFFHNEVIDQFKTFDQLKVTYTNESEFLGQLFVYADEIEIVKPKSLRDSFVKKAQNAIRLNSPPKKKSA